MEIGKMLKEKRAEYELTQEQLSEKIFVSKKTISNWETGKTTPDLDSLIRLANLFDLSLDNLLLEGNKVTKNIIKREKIGEEIEKNKKIWSFSYVINIIFVITISLSSLFEVKSFSMGTGVKVSMLVLMLMNIYLLNFLTKEKKRLNGVYKIDKYDNK
ncbi:helix-turn-helix domain-containing protein (plasmid) [Vagococcus sp. JNUCC 83]